MTAKYWSQCTFVFFRAFSTSPLLAAKPNLREVCGILGANLFSRQLPPCPWPFYNWLLSFAPDVKPFSGKRLSNMVQDRESLSSWLTCYLNLPLLPAHRTPMYHIRPLKFWAECNWKGLKYTKSSETRLWLIVPINTERGKSICDRQERNILPLSVRNESPNVLSEGGMSKWWTIYCVWP